MKVRIDDAEVAKAFARVCALIRRDLGVFGALRDPLFLPLTVIVREDAGPQGRPVAR